MVFKFQIKWIGLKKKNRATVTLISDAKHDGNLVIKNLNTDLNLPSSSLSSDSASPGSKL